ncbi:MAG TPA: glucokinase, partial [bacterium]|nr:glucokinase [bacterium]
MILAGDVGGTKIHLALIADDGEPDHPSTEARLRTADVRELPQAVAAFAQASAGPIRAGVLGVAGPVMRGEIHGTNLPWSVSAAEMSRALGGAPVTLLNDLEAAAHGLDLLTPDEIEVLQEGRPQVDANRV